MICARVPLVLGQKSLPLLLTAALNRHPHCQDSALAQASSSPDLLSLSPLSLLGLLESGKGRKLWTGPRLSCRLQIKQGSVAGPAAGPVAGLVAALLGLHS